MGGPSSAVGEPPVPLAVGDRRLAEAALGQPGPDRPLALGGREAAEPAGVDEDLLVLCATDSPTSVPTAPRSRPVLRADDRSDREPVPFRERVVALVVRGHGHHRSGAVLHQHESATQIGTGSPVTGLMA